MRLMLKTALVAVCLAVSVPAAAGPFEDGNAAYSRGDYAGAVKWYRLAAAQGLDFAQFALGAMYENGQGVPKDYAEAVRWYRLAAAQGLDFAEFALGTMYENGQGVPRDYTEAVRWYRLAAAQGIVDAQVNLGAMYENGRGVPQDYVLAHMWFNLVAGQDHADAANAAKNRDRVATLMTPAQIAEAQRLAREWKSTPPR